ncbi:hypothetical protein EZS27_042787, partial [termite gut metagenome]
MVAGIHCGSFRAGICGVILFKLLHGLITAMFFHKGTDIRYPVVDFLPELGK